MLTVKNLTKYYKSKIAVRDVSFIIDKGEITGLIGINGSGKSTIMNIISGYLSSYSGDIKINNININEDPVSYKKYIGYLPETPPLYKDMTIREQLKFSGKMKGVLSEDIDSEIDRVCRLTDISKEKKYLIGSLSKGYKQRIGLAQALIGSPEYLLLDEPMSGLDPHQIKEFRELFKNLKGKTSVIISSHILSEIDMICDNVLIINNGTLVSDNRTENQDRSSEKFTYHVIRLDNSYIEFSSDILEIPGVVECVKTESPEFNKTDYIIKSSKRNDIRNNLFKLLCRKERAVFMLKPYHKNLEETFLELI